MAIIQEVCLAKLGVVQRQHKIITMELFVEIEVVADHERVFNGVMRELLPHWSVIALETFKIICRSLSVQILDTTRLFVEENEQESKCMKNYVKT